MSNKKPTDRKVLSFVLSEILGETVYHVGKAIITRDRKFIFNDDSELIEIVELKEII